MQSTTMASPGGEMTVEGLEAATFTQAIEMMWLFGAANLAQTNNEIIIPFNIVEKHGSAVIDSLSQRLQDLLNAPIVMIIDKSIGCYRIRPERADPAMPLGFDTHHALSKAVHSAVDNGVHVPIEPLHVPRPPNSFILYRQHHHHAVTAANPGVQNTQISRIIANMWKEETPEVRARFKELANKKKEIHAQMNPGYQYTPRRPGDKLRRRRARIATRYVQFLGATTAGTARIEEANSQNQGKIDVDGDFLDLLAAHGVLNGPNGVAPGVGLHQNLDFQAIVQEQFDRVALNAVQFPPLQGNEFDDSFPMAEMLELEGA